MSVKVESSAHEYLCSTVKIFKANNCKRWMYQNVSMQMLERVGESDHVPAVCVLGHWVTLILSMP